MPLTVFKWLYMRKLFLIPLIFLFTACGNLQSKKQLDVIREGLGRTTNYLSGSNELISWKLENRLWDPITKEKITMWSPVINSIRHAIVPVLNSIDSLSVVTPASKLLSTRKETRDFFNQLFQCKTSLFATLDSIPGFLPEGARKKVEEHIAQLKVETPFLQGLDPASSTDAIEKWYADWTDIHFNKSSSQFFYSMLAKIRNDLLMTENGLLTYCEINTAGGRSSYEVSSDEIMAMVDRETIRDGDTATLKISTFPFNTRLLQLTVDGRPVRAPDDNGVVRHGFIAKGKPGKYYFSIKVICLTPGGSRFEKSERAAYFIEP